MKNLKKVLSLILLSAMITGVMCSCSKKLDKKNAGVYKLSEVKRGDQTLDESMLSMQESFGLVSYIELMENGKVLYCVDTSEITGSWDGKYITIEGERAKYSVDGDVLTINRSDSEMKFKKSSKEEINEILSNAGN